jgi:hypothetical protein
MSDEPSAVKMHLWFFAVAPRNLLRQPIVNDSVEKAEQFNRSFTKH